MTGNGLIEAGGRPRGPPPGAIPSCGYFLSIISSFFIPSSFIILSLPGQRTAERTRARRKLEETTGKRAHYAKPAVRLSSDSRGRPPGRTAKGILREPAQAGIAER